MKSIRIAILTIIYFAFVPVIDAKDDSGVSKGEGNKPVKFSIPYRLPESAIAKPARPKFNVSIGAGNGYKLGDKVWGRYPFDNSPTPSIRLGYSPCKYVELQGEYSNANFYRKSWWGEQYLRFNNYGLNLKFKAPLNIKGVVFSPYFIVGTGKTKEVYEGIDTGMKFKYSGFGKYTKIGGGAEINIYKNIMLFSEFNYWKMGSIKLNLGNGIEIENYPYFSSVIGGIGLRF